MAAVKREEIGRSVHCLHRGWYFQGPLPWMFSSNSILASSSEANERKETRLQTCGLASTLQGGSCVAACASLSGGPSRAVVCSATCLNRPVACGCVLHLPLRASRPNLWQTGTYFCLSCRCVCTVYVCLRVCINLCLSCACVYVCMCIYRRICVRIYLYRGA